MSQHTPLPSTLPAPTDDGALSHIHPGSTHFPSVSLPSTSKSHPNINPSSLPGLKILYIYPRSGAPGETVPESWNQIPGARGCTPQACAYNSLHSQLLSAGVSHVFAISTQSTEYQREFKERNSLEFEVLSDEDGKLREGLGLPSFEWEGEKVLKRVTMAVGEGGVIEKIWYPVFPPDRNAGEVLEWVKGRNGKK